MTSNNKLNIEECKYKSDNPKPLDYYAYRLAIILSTRGGRSSYTFTKEVRSALERIINELDWMPDKDSWLSLITQSEAPEDLAPCKEAALCLLDLFEGLLRRFTENVEKLPPGMRQVYANILVSAIERTARFPSNLQEDAKQFKSKFFGLCSSSESSPLEDNKEEGGGNK